MNFIKMIKEVFMEDLYISRFFDTNDEKLIKIDEFNIPADWWSRFYEYAWAIKFTNKNFVVLDAGAGIRHPFQFILSSRCKHVYVCDIDQDIINHEKLLRSVIETCGGYTYNELYSMLNNMSFSLYDLTNMLYESEKFDVVFCISVIEHMPKESIIMALKEFSRVIKKDGLIVITFDYPCNTLEFLIELAKNLDLLPFSVVNYSEPENAIYLNEWNYRCCRLVLRKA